METGLVPATPIHEKNSNCCRIKCHVTSGDGISIAYLSMYSPCSQSHLVHSEDICHRDQLLLCQAKHLATLGNNVVFLNTEKHILWTHLTFLISINF